MDDVRVLQQRVPQTDQAIHAVVERSCRANIRLRHVHQGRLGRDQEVMTLPGQLRDLFIEDQGREDRVVGKGKRHTDAFGRRPRRDIGVLPRHEIFTRVVF